MRSHRLKACTYKLYMAYLISSTMHNDLASWNVELAIDAHRSNITYAFHYKTKQKVINRSNDIVLRNNRQCESDALKNDKNKEKNIASWR